MKPPVPPSRHSTSEGNERCFEGADDVDADAFVAHEDVAEAEDQRLLLAGVRLFFTFLPLELPSANDG